MNAKIMLRFSKVLILATLGLLGCSQEGGRNGAALLAPAPQDVADLATSSEATIVIPFNSLNFAVPANNQFFPLAPGTAWSYVAETPDGVETNEVEVTRSTKTILGVKTHVIHDRVFLNGSLTEDTFDWYASDQYGNVWYFGEDTREIEDGVVVTTAGSWEAGKNGANPGIIMLAHPKIGDTYRQEDAPGVVEDMGKVLSLKETVTVPYGTFESCLQTADWTPLEPGNRSFKYYAAGFGVVLEVTHSGGGERVELTGFKTK